MNLQELIIRHNHIGHVFGSCSLEADHTPGLIEEEWLQVEILLEILQEKGLLDETDQTQPRADADQVSANAGDAQGSDTGESEAT